MNKITLYTTATCPRCKILKDKMATKGIDYEECQDIDIMTELGIEDVPKIKKDDELLSFGEAVAWINSL